MEKIKNILKEIKEVVFELSYEANLMTIEWHSFFVDYAIPYGEKEISYECNEFIIYVKEYVRELNQHIYKTEKQIANNKEKAKEFLLQITELSNEGIFDKEGVEYYKVDIPNAIKRTRLGEWDKEDMERDFDKVIKLLEKIEKIKEKIGGFYGKK